MNTVCACIQNSEFKNERDTRLLLTCVSDALTEYMPRHQRVSQFQLTIPTSYLPRLHHKAKILQN